MLTAGNEAVDMSYLIDEHAAHLRATPREERSIKSRVQLLRRLHAHCEGGLAYAATAEIESFLAGLRRAGRPQGAPINHNGPIPRLYEMAPPGGPLPPGPTPAPQRGQPPRV